MARVEDKYIVAKGREWLMSGRPDLLELPHAHVFSIYIHDAKQFDSRREAKKRARKVGGTVWVFNPVTGKREECVSAVPPGAKCDTCRKWTPYDGVCRNPDSENYRVPVSMEDVCDEWGDKEDGRKGRVDP